MVFSDPHVLAPCLFDTAAVSFKNYYPTEPKLVEHSAELFDSAVARVMQVHPDILLIPGDLTKDGELASHQYVKHHLDSLVNNGIQVYVVPGNHDVANPSSYAYLGATKQATDNISAEEFAAMYAACGYDSAIMRMPATLSYMVYPAPGLALICLDSTVPNGTSRSSGGGLSSATLAWAKMAADSAHADGRAIIGMMHHQIVNHFTDEAEFASNYVANSTNLGADYPELAEVQDSLIAAGFRAMLTGHFHIQSIQKSYRYTTTLLGDKISRLEANHLTDISTGALCSYANAIRTMTYADSVLTITSDTLGMYHDIEQERNKNTVRGAIQQLAPKGYTKLMSKLPTLITDTAVLNHMNIPADANEFARQLTRYFLEPGTVVFNSLSRGDEDKNAPNVLYHAVKDSIEQYMTYVINGQRYTLFGINLFETLLKPTFYEMANPYMYSVLYNWVDEDDRQTSGNHYMADWENSVRLFVPEASDNEPPVDTHIETAPQADPAIEKFLHDGQMFINAWGRIFNATGTRVR